MYVFTPKCMWIWCAPLGAVDIWLMYVTLKMMIKRLQFHLVQSSCRFIPFNYYLGHIYKWRRFWWWTEGYPFRSNFIKGANYESYTFDIAEHNNWMLPFLLNKKNWTFTHSRNNYMLLKHQIGVFWDGSECFLSDYFFKVFFDPIFELQFRSFFELYFRSDFFVRLEYFCLEYFRSIICFVNIWLIKYVLVWRYILFNGRPPRDWIQTAFVSSRKKK